MSLPALGTCLAAQGAIPQHPAVFTLNIGKVCALTPLYVRERGCL